MESSEGHIGQYAGNLSLFHRIILAFSILNAGTSIVIYMFIQQYWLVYLAPCVVALIVYTALVLCHRLIFPKKEDSQDQEKVPFVITTILSTMLSVFLCLMSVDLVHYLYPSYFVAFMLMLVHGVASLVHGIYLAKKGID